jgi:YihY family inner membrane protein
MTARLAALWAVVRAGFWRLVDRIAPWPPVRVAVALVRTFRRRGCVPRAAEIAFYTVLSVVPLTVLVLTALGYASVHLLDLGWTLADIGVSLGATLPEVLPHTAEASALAVGLLVEDRQELGWLGGLATVVVASLSFGAVSRSVANVFEQTRRSLFSTLLSFVVLAACLLALASIVIGLVVGVSAGASLPSLAQGALALHLTGLGVISLGFVMVIRLVLRTKPSWTWTGFGAASFVGLFELARWLYAVYLGTLSQLHLVYGSLAGTMAAILWAYYVAFIFLLSVCAVRVLDARLYASDLGDLPR